MGAEPFPLEYGATHDPSECTCRVLRRPRLRSKRFDRKLDELKQAVVDGCMRQFYVIEVEKGLFWVECHPCKSRERWEGRRSGRIVRTCGGAMTVPEPVQRPSPPWPDRTGWSPRMH